MNVDCDAGMARDMGHEKSTYTSQWLMRTSYLIYRIRPRASELDAMIPRSASRTEVIVALTPRSCQARFHRRGDVDCALMAFVDSTIANCSREMPMDGEFLATQADDVPVAREEGS